MKAMKVVGSNGMLERYQDKSSDRMASAAPGRLKIDRAKWAELNEPGIFMMIHKQALSVDHTYQREQTSEKRVMDIAKNWDWMLFGAISVVQRNNGDLCVIDGGHRWRASWMRADVDKIPCMVFDGDALPVREEAKAYIGVNMMQKKVSAIDKFRAGIVAEDPVVMECVRILSLHGLAALDSKPPGMPKGFEAVGNLTRCVKDNAERAAQAMEWSVSVAAASGDMVPGRFFASVYAMIGRDPRVLDSEWVDRACKLGFDVLVQYGKKREVVEGSYTPAIFGKGMMDGLNKAKRGGPKLKWE